MKKILSALLMLSFLATSVAQADAVRDDSLGNPILNVNDTAILARYAAALQNFPSTIYALFDGTANYFRFGMGYKASDMLALAWTYESVPTTGVELFLYDGAFVDFIGYSQVASIVYGGKVGEMLFGASAKINYFDNKTFTTTTYDTNGVVTEKAGFSGFKATLNPSIILGLGEMQLYAGVDASLNFMKWYDDMTTNWGPDSVINPSLLDMITVKAMLTKDLNETTTLGVEAAFYAQNNGYSYQTVTNNVDVEATNSYEDTAIAGSLSIGSKIQATEAVTIFADLKTVLVVDTAQHKTGDNKNTYNVQTIWEVPSVTLGADFEIVKNLNLRISAVPTYTVTTTKLASWQSVGGNATVDAGVFSVQSDIGLGWTIGAFKINWELDINFLNNALLTPMTFLDIQGTGPALASRVQVNFSF